MANIVFNVPVGPVNVRNAPSLSASIVTQLTQNAIVDVVDNSRTEAEGFVWWRHSLGWSVERSLDGKSIFMVEITSFQTGENPPKEVKVTPDPKPPQKRFRVQTALNVRDRPALSGALVGTKIPAGTLLDVDATSRTEADALIWWRHATGWSAERAISNSLIFMVEAAGGTGSGTSPQPVTPPPPPPPPADPTVVGIPNDVLDVSKLPQRDALVARHPLDLSIVNWVQYYGNTQFAFTDGARWGYDGYAQGLHSGIDYGGPSAHGKPVFAGVFGRFVRVDRFGIRINTGNYIVIYQHLIPARTFARDESITPDTVLGTFDMSLGSNAHVHFEIRPIGERHIINPLIMMPIPMRLALMTKYVPWTSHFQRTAAWTQWQSPLEQPVITVGAQRIGPRA